MVGITKHREYYIFLYFSTACSFALIDHLKVGLQTHKNEACFVGTGCPLQTVSLIF
jgi:hypothetical protein